MKSQKVYSLWESLKDMAQDLGEGASHLLRLREAGDLPDQKHDPKILARAMFQGVHLHQRHLDQMREDASKRLDATERKEAIREFFDEAGGTVLLAQKLGTSANALRVAQSRAKLPKNWKYDAMMVAKKIGHNLNEVLFEDF